ncbi:hypothetical protein [Bradyrhizobium sp.]|uniref:hypothetical protein n=1 Tax=Bradyrhizobium sp. TaxID=376 RepID=UPI0025B8C394|nr:hypothetical protein [Bradyrhizobium sp.]
MNLQPVQHGSITPMQSRPIAPESNAKPKKAAKKPSTRAEEVRIAKAKLSRRSSLIKQRRALKG